MRPFVWLAACLLALAPAAAASAGGRPAWHGYDCPWVIEGGRQVECGMMEVPERWDLPDSRSIFLPVRILRAGRDRGLPPVVYLSGGPGQDMGFDDAAGIEDWFHYLENGMGWSRGRDVVLLAQRGIVTDGVGLACPELGDPRNYLGASEVPGRQGGWEAKVRRANRACLDWAAAAGHDLAGYSTTQSARDVAALRRLLGIPGWVLFGVSYGTRLGLTVLRDDPEGVVAAVFDSVFPPEIRDHWTDASPFDDALYMLMRNCAADADCAAAYPDLERRLGALLTRLAAEPIPMWVEDYSGEAPSLHFDLDDVTLIDMIFYNLYWLDDIERLPRAIDAIDRGDVDLFRDLVANDYVYDSLFDNWSWGMQAAIGCNDDFAWFDADALRAEMARRPRLANWLATALTVPPCEGWPVQPRDAGFSRPVTSDLPVLLLAGEYDPVTPVRYADAALRHLPNGRLAVIPHVSHSVLDAAACAGDIVRDFLRDPSAPLADHCARVPPPVFDVP
jgi:pimeloyl-ACP methyl ester carboxylesterase